GNVDTRLRKLDEESCEAIVLAAAGLARLELAPPHARPLEPEDFVPAVGQGILALEARAADRLVLDVVAGLDHADTRVCAMAERSVLPARPLAGRRVLVTRAAAQASAFARLLREAGATVIEAPTIAIEPPVTWQPLDEAIARIVTFRWVIFTSVNGVGMFAARLSHHGLAWTALGHARVAAIGPATAAALEVHGVRAEVVPDEYRAEGLVARLRALVGPGAAVRLARVAIASIGPITAETAASLGFATRIMPAEYTVPALTSAIAAYFSNASERS